MTNPTPHGQVPEALRLAEQYDHGDPAAHGNAWKAAVCTELRRLAELEAQIEALSGVQALSAAPAGWKLVPVEPTRSMMASAVIFANGNAVYKNVSATALEIEESIYGEAYSAMLAASPTPPALSAAPVEQDDHQILAITTAYEQGVGKGHQAYNSGKEIANPYSPAYRCDLAWQYGYKEGKEQAQREAKAAPQPSPAPLSDDVVKDAARYRWLREGNDAKHGAAWHVAVNLYGCEWDASIDAALAAQGGKV